jgi:hypothetical protein
VQGTIAQIIALVTYGNAFLSGSPQREPSAFYSANSTFIFCEDVRFVDLKPTTTGWVESAYAADPSAWFTQLKRDGVYGLRIVHRPTGGHQLGDEKVPDRMLVASVGGGGQWLIEAIKPNGSDFWEGRWEVGNREHKAKKIWRVTYGRDAKNQRTPDLPKMDILALKNQLAKNLEAIGAFARRQKMEEFAKAFDAGLAQLSSNDPLRGVYYSDLVPENTRPLAAAQLLGAAQAAWVFGGMGSWNDVGFDGEDQLLYERLSEDLYQLLNAAIVLAVNADTPSNQSKQSGP